MTEKELKQLVEDLIADACNVINHNVKKIAQAEWPKRWQA